MFPLISERLIIRHLLLEDAESLDRIFGDAEVMKYGDGIQAHEWVRRWVHGVLEQYNQRGFGPYAVLERSSTNLIGYCGLFYFANVNGKPEVEIGYRFVRSAWGKGFASEAAATVRDYAFTSLRLERLIAIIDPSNSASIRVATKIGMKYEQEVMFEGYTHPDHIYAVNRTSST